MAERLTHYTTDHDTIRRWAQERSAQPTRVRGTGGRGKRNDIGMIQLDFPGYSGRRNLQPVSWEEWFEQFDTNNLVLIYQEHTADGQQSNFNRLISAETASGQGRGEPGTPRRAGRQETGRRTGSTRSRSQGNGRTSGGRTGSSAARSSRDSARGLRTATGSASRGTGGRARSGSRR